MISAFTDGHSGEKQMDKIVIIGNGIDWLDSCYESMKSEDVFYTNRRIPLHSKSRLINAMIRFWFSVKNKKRQVIKLPLRSMWFRYSDFRKFVSKDDSIKFLLYDSNRLSRDEKYLRWIRKKYKKCSLSYVFTNIASKSVAGQYGMLGQLRGMYDYVFAFDKADSEKYGFEYNHLIYAPVLPKEKAEIKYDILFVGGAKERLDTLHAFYQKLCSMGLRPCFYIMGVQEKDQLRDSDIHYNQRIPYTQTMELLSQSKCILDILQQGSSGISLRICESVVWNKLIITDNPYVRNEPFFSENNILVVSSPDDVKPEFFTHIPDADSKYTKLFVPERLFDKIKKP